MLGARVRRFGSVQSLIARPKQAINLHERLAVHRMIVHRIDLRRHEADTVHIFNRFAEPPRIFVESDYRQLHEHALRSRDSFSASFNHLALETLSVDFNEDVSLAFCRNVIESPRRYALNAISDYPTMEFLGVISKAEGRIEFLVCRNIDFELTGFRAYREIMDSPFIV
jgi:hypothetical protein